MVTLLVPALCNPVLASSPDNPATQAPVPPADGTAALVGHQDLVTESRAALVTGHQLYDLLDTRVAQIEADLVCDVVMERSGEVGFQERPRCPGQQLPVGEQRYGESLVERASGAAGAQRGKGRCPGSLPRQGW